MNPLAYFCQVNDLGILKTAPAFMPLPIVVPKSVPPLPRSTAPAASWSLLSLKLKTTPSNQIPPSCFSAKMFHRARQTGHSSSKVTR